VSARVCMRAVTGRLLALTGSPYRALLVFSGISTPQCSRYERLVEIVGWRGERGFSRFATRTSKFHEMYYGEFQFECRAKPFFFAQNRKNRKKNRQNRAKTG